MFKYLAATLFTIVAIQSAAASPTYAPGPGENCGKGSDIVACANDLQCCFIPSLDHNICVPALPICPKFL